MFHGVCEYCSKSFESPRKRLTCSRSHAQLLVKSRHCQEWKDAEIALIEKLAGTQPADVIVRRLQILEKRHKWPVRTDTAILLKMKRLGLSRVCDLDNINLSEIARILGIPRDRPEAWKDRHQLPVKKGVRNYSVRKADFVAWAKLNPHLLADVDLHGLSYLTDDDQLVETVSAMKRPKIGIAQPVIRLDTKEVYPSVRAAARACYVVPSSIRRSLSGEGKCLGTRWMFANEVRSDRA